MTRTCKSLLPISLVLFCSLIFRTTGAVVATVSPGCEQTNQRTLSLGVKSEAGAPVDNLRAEDLSLLEDKAAREILKLETTEALSVAILIDASVSQAGALPLVRLAAQKFVETLLRASNDRAAVVSFARESSIEQNLTNDLASLQSAISNVDSRPPPGFFGKGVIVRGPVPSGANRALAGSTAIWDAVSSTSEGVLRAAADSRRAIVLLTDGEDTSSDKKRSEAIQAAARYDVRVFAIRTAHRSLPAGSRDGLQELSEETGGRVFSLNKPREIPEILRQIDQELQSVYRLTYCAADSKAQTSRRSSRIKIQLNNPRLRAQNLRLRYPKYGF